MARLRANLVTASQPSLRNFILLMLWVDQVLNAINSGKGRYAEIIQIARPRSWVISEISLKSEFRFSQPSMEILGTFSELFYII